MVPASSFRRIARAAGFAVWLSVAAALASGQVAGVSNFQKVNDQVYRGGQPTSDGFKNLAAMGVKTVIDLRLIGEHSQAEEENWVEADGMCYLSIPLKGMSAPPEAEVANILAILNDPSAGPVFVHCRRGADRTGTILACYRISHDHWENRQALQEARGLGMSFLERAMQNFVLRFNPGEPKVVASAPTPAVQAQ
jgi:tyrosine-protein phosphatase SIW14